MPLIINLIALTCIAIAVVPANRWLLAAVVRRRSPSLLADEAFENSHPNEQAVSRLPNPQSSNWPLPSASTATSSAALKKHQRWVEVAAIVPEANQTVSLYLTDINGGALPNYIAGQFIQIERPSEGAFRARSNCYSLSLNSGHGIWRITVKQVGPNERSDSISHWINRSLREGDWLKVSSPMGRFNLNLASEPKPIAFIAAGIGITPIASMLYEALNQPPLHPKVLFYQVRDSENAPLADELIESIQQSQGLAQGYFAYSQELPFPPIESPFIETTQTKLNARQILERMGTHDFYSFLCGPNEWMNSMKEGLIQAGVSPSHIFDEGFGSPTPMTPDQSSNSHQPVLNIPNNLAPQTNFQVNFEYSNASSSTKELGPEATILDLAEKLGVNIPSGCRSGDCGTCVVKQISGKVRYKTKPSCTIQSDEVIACVAIPDSDISLDI